MKISKLTCQDLIKEGFTTFPGSPIINSPEIKWHIQDLTPDMPEASIIEVFRKTFLDILQPHFSPIKFESTSEIRKANIVIHFANNGDRDLPQPFESGTLAYAYAPYRNKSDIWFNDEYLWGDMHSSRRISLLKVAVHEILHSLGLGHSEIQDDILFWQYQNNNEVNVTSDTTSGIDHLYGDLKKSIEPEEAPVPVPPAPTPEPEPETPEEPELPDGDLGVVMNPNLYAKGISSIVDVLKLKGSIIRRNIKLINEVIDNSFGDRPLVDADVYAIPTLDGSLFRRYPVVAPVVGSPEFDEEVRFVQSLVTLRDLPFSELDPDLPDAFTKVSYFLDKPAFHTWDYQPGENFLTSIDEWAAIQRGEKPKRELTYSKKVPITTGRLAASYVHRDHWTAPFESAVQELLNLGCPNKLPKRMTGSKCAHFASMGIVFHSGLLGETVRRMGLLSFREKWGQFVPRPEEYSFKKFAVLLSQTYPEGSPMHPSRNAMHSVAAQACAGLVLELFDNSFVLPNGNTVYNEITLLEENIGCFRIWAGVHYPSDHFGTKERAHALGRRVANQYVR